MIELAAFTAGLYMSGWFVISLLLRRNDVADVAWGLGFVVLAWSLYFSQPSAQFAAGLLLVSIWGIRLSVHIFLRNKGKPEDFRYQKWRNDWGRWFYPRSFVQVFALQGLLMLFISAPIVALADGGGDSLRLINYFGVALWSIGFFFEAVGDYQLRQFMKTPRSKGKVMNQGLWAYTRHPNYFGEVTQWWGIWLISCGTPWFWWALIGPVTITVLLLKVSGIPLLEKKYEGNKAYEVYKKQTSKFFPLPVKKG